MHRVNQRNFATVDDAVHNEKCLPEESQRLPDTVEGSLPHRSSIADTGTRATEASNE
jgi:hypothetical protein